MINLKEIYTRTQDDIFYNDEKIEHSNVLEAYIQKIKMILNTSPGDVFGFPNFGAGLKEFLFETNVNKNKVRKRINEQISTYCIEAKFFKTDVEISFMKGTVRDMMLVDISIDGKKEIGVLIK